jgi:hydroxyacylglutathione hydrolase
VAERSGGEASGRDSGQVFTGDTLFKGSVGGVRAPGSTSYADLKSSVMDTLLTLPPDTVIRPGHTDPTTVAEELESNAFVRIWRGLDEEGSEPVTALGEPATLILWGPDYDGGHKAWVRWPDGSDDIVGGSRVERRPR